MRWSCAPHMVGCPELLAGQEPPGERPRSGLWPWKEVEVLRSKWETIGGRMCRRGLERISEYPLLLILWNMMTPNICCHLFLFHSSPFDSVLFGYIIFYSVLLCSILFGTFICIPLRPKSLYCAVMLDYIIVKYTILYYRCSIVGSIFTCVHKYICPAL